MITPSYDHEPAVCQIVRFIDMRVGDTESPQGPQWKRNQMRRKVLKEEGGVPPLWGTAGYEASAISPQIVPRATPKLLFLPPNLPTAWKEHWSMRNLWKKTKILFLHFKSEEKKKNKLTLIIKLVLVLQLIIKYFPWTLWS